MSVNDALDYAIRVIRESNAKAEYENKNKTQ